MSLFKLHAPFPPAGDQAQAIEALAQARPGKSTLLGVTGSGKTYTMAQVIARQNKPVLVLAPNKTLAAQLYEEFCQFFPENKVCYFVSYYDYYQPESYVPAKDLYIPKESKVNAEIERLRVETTASLITRPDTIVIASVSAIYSLGDPTDYRTAATPFQVGMPCTVSSIQKNLEAIQYRQSMYDRLAGTFHIDGGVVDVVLPYTKDRLQLVVEDGKLAHIRRVRKLDDAVLGTDTEALIFPARHFVMGAEKIHRAVDGIQAELDLWLPKLPPIARERLQTRVATDIELLQSHGYCPGIENYSVHFDGRPWSAPPFCLFDFFSDMLVILDESHQMIPQLQGMYAGDRARKKQLIAHGFRLPSAYDNRPLRFDEIERAFKDIMFVSATPGRYELERSDHIVEQILRPTGLVDPHIEIHPRTQQLEHLCAEIHATTSRGYRSLVTVLTKKMAEELALYLERQRIKVCYLHSDLKTPQRTEILHKLRAGVLDCVVGVNLLREGLDLPEVALVAIMDADVEGFLRDKRSLIQTIGRAARNVHAKVLLYADKTTDSMREAISETQRRRDMQEAHNQLAGIEPRTTVREITKSITPIQRAIARAAAGEHVVKKRALHALTPVDLSAKIARLTSDMHEAANQHDYDRAITIRDELFALQKRQAELGTQS